jgi:HK97 family phage prohead protease
MEKSLEAQPLSPEDAAKFAAELPRHERRFLNGDVSVEATDKGPRIHMLIPYDKPSEEMHSRSIGDFTEVVRSTAFTKTVQEHRDSIVSCWNHNADFVLGRPSNGTMEMRSEPRGMTADVQLDGQDPMHVSFARRVERRDVTGSSFGFDPVRTPATRQADGSILRELVEVRLRDISPVAFPAYPDSTAEKRSLDPVLEVASVRAGIRLDDLAAALVRMEQRHIVAPDVATVRSILKRLETLMPPETAAFVPLALRSRRLAMFERELGLTVRSKTTEKSWEKPSLGDFYPDKTWDELTEAQQDHVKSCYAWAPADAKSFGDLKLPYKHPDGTVNLNAVRNALSRLPQTEGIPEDEKAKIETKLEKILGDAKDKAA